MTQLTFQYEVTNQVKPLKGYALKLTQNANDADDLVQETMLKALSNKDKFMEGSNLKGWLYTIMKNLFINNYRRISKGAVVLDDTDNQYYINNAGFADQNVGESKMIVQDIMRAINRLSDNLRTPFMLNFTGYKYEEIAQRLNIPLGTVKIRIFNARQHLKKSLKPYGDAYGLSAQ